MFCFATLYYEGAVAIHKTAYDHEFNQTAPKVYHNKTLWGLFIPSSVLLAFSLEIFLKCLMQVRGNNPIRGHKTKELFSELSLRDRRHIGHMFRSERATRGDTVSLKSVFARASNYFDEMRYGYEKPVPRLPAGGIKGLDLAAEAVRLVILDKHPDWQQRYLDRESFL